MPLQMDTLATYTHTNPPMPKWGQDYEVLYTIYGTLALRVRPYGSLRTPYMPVIIGGESYLVAKTIPTDSLVLYSTQRDNLACWSLWDIQQSLREWKIKEGRIWERPAGKTQQNRMISFFQNLLQIANQLGVK